LIFFFTFTVQALQQHFVHRFVLHDVVGLRGDKLQQLRTGLDAA
jgi:hypothetical protein